MRGPTKKRFEVIFSHGKRVKGDLAKMIAAPGAGLVGIAVSKKTGSKPPRNRLKRRFKEAILTRQAMVDSRLDYVVVVNSEAKLASFERIDREVQALLANIAKRWAAELECS